MFADEELQDFDFEELDNEIGLGELLKQKDNFFVSLFKKLVFGILIVIIGIMVFYASFTIGKVLFLSDNPLPASFLEAEEAELYNDNKNIIITKDMEDKTLVIEEEEEPLKQQIKDVEIKNQEAKEPVATKKEAESLPKYALIAGTFGQMDNARKVQTKVSLLGFKPEIKSIVRNNTTYYRVIAKTFVDIEEANKAKKTLDSAGIDNFLAPLSQ